MGSSQKHVESESNIFWITSSFCDLHFKVLLDPCSGKALHSAAPPSSCASSASSSVIIPPSGTTGCCPSRYPPLSHPPPENQYSSVLERGFEKSSLLIC